MSALGGSALLTSDLRFRTAPPLDDLDRLHRRLVETIRSSAPEFLARPFEVSQLYQQIIPYRTNRRELGFDTNDEYELALMQLLAGLRGYLTGDAELQSAMRNELASPSPDLSSYRLFATSIVSLAPSALPAADERSSGNAPVAARVFELAGPHAREAEQAVMAARVTEVVEVAPTVDVTTSLVSTAPVPRPARSTSPDEFPMLPSRPSQERANAGHCCRYCSGALPDGRHVTFCPGCGHNLTVQHCPACSSELELEWKFCITCGRGVS
ncbi:MAG: zinc ribbon domain-containing protein [Gemmatimonadaceae bacterium]